MRSQIGRTVQAVGVHLAGNGGSARHRADAVRCGVRAIVASLLLAGVGVAVSAQEPAAPEGLTLDEAGNGWVVAPDFKFTRVDDGDAALVGAYGGRFIDRRLLVGGGAYWLSGAPDVGMAYGGGLAEWFGNPGGLVDFSVRGFVGLGTATLSERFGFSDGCGDFSVSNFDMPGTGDIKGGLPIGAMQPCGPGAMLDAFAGGGSRSDGRFRSVAEWDIGWLGDPFREPFGLRQNFFLAEPQASIHLNVTSWVRITGGAGYRLIGGGDFPERLRGLTANIGVQIGPR